jgi:uncharacterized membrane protein required for colicin V production
MEFGRYSLALAITGVTTILVAALLIWVLLTEPVALADALSRSDLSSLLQAIGNAIVEGWKTVARYF